MALYRKDKFEGSSLALLIMHPFNFTPGLQPGNSGTQGFINGVVRLKTLLEKFLKVWIHRPATYCSNEPWKTYSISYFSHLLRRGKP